MTALLYEKEASAMASYQDMQQSLKAQRDAQFAYFSELKRIFDAVVGGYADHVASGPDAKEKPRVIYGYKGFDKFEHAPSDKQVDLTGTVMSGSIGVYVKESANSIAGGWVPLVINMKRLEGCYLASVCPVDRPDVDCAEARMRDAADVAEIYDAMTAVIMGVLDPSIYE